MTSWQILNRICFTICVICIIGGTVLSLSMIWVTHDSEFLAKSWGTMGVLFVGSLLTLIVSRIVGGKSESPAAPLAITPIKTVSYRGG